MVASAREVYALLDSEKFHITGVSLFARFKELTGIVTTYPIKNQDLLKVLEQNHVKVFYANQ